MLLSFPPFLNFRNSQPTLFFRADDIFRRPTAEWERYSQELPFSDWTFLVAIQEDDGLGIFQAQITGADKIRFPIQPIRFLTGYPSDMEYQLHLAPVEIRELIITLFYYIPTTIYTFPKFTRT